MQYNKLVVIHWQNLDKRYCDLTAIPELIKMGITVEYWDVSAITLPGYTVNSYPAPDGLVIRTVKSTKQFAKLLSSNDIETAYLLHMNYCDYTFRCYRLLSKYKCTIIYSVNGCMPGILSEYSSLFSYLKALPLKALAHFAMQKLYRVIAKTSLIKTTDYILASCKDAYNRRECKIGPSTVWVNFNSGDYQQYIVSDTKVNESMEDSIVFIDQNLPFHPDSKLQGFQMDADNYFEAINKLFDEIELKYNKKVVIAAHPSCYNSYANGGFFNGRKVVQGNTLELVRTSYAVIAHNSTAISFPVICNKPIIFIATDEMQTVRKRICSFCSMFSKLLNCVYLASEHNIVLPDVLSVDESAYNSYKYQFLTNPDTERFSNGHIIFSLLQGKYSNNS